MKNLAILLLLFQCFGLVAQSDEDTDPALVTALSADDLKEKIIGADELPATPQKTFEALKNKSSMMADSLSRSMKLADSLLNGISNIDTLLKAKARLLKQKIDNLQGKLSFADSLKSRGLSTPDIPDSLAAKLSDNLSVDLPDLSELNEKINGLLPELPEDKQLLAQQHNLELDQLNSALEGVKEAAKVNIPDIDQLSRYAENLEELQSQWTTHSSLLEDLKQGTLTEESVDLKFLEDKLGKLPVLEEFATELPAMPDDPLSALSSQQEIPDHYKKLQELQQQAKDWIQKSKIEPGQTMEEAKGRLDALKEKYTTVPSSLNLGSAIKKNSLKERLLKERMVFGGYFDFTLDPVMIEAAPTLGYRLNKKWQVGVATYWEYHFEKEARSDIKDEYNVSGYSQYKFWKGMLVHGEYRLLRQRAENNAGEATHWRGEGYGGIGKTISLKGSWQAQLLVLYNFSHDPGAAFTERWATRWGVTRNLSFGK